MLKQLHDELDTAVFAAYGWSDLASDTGFQPVPTGATGRMPVSPSDAARPLADRLAASDSAAAAFEQEILSRLVALNRERTAEEERGLVRWLRPEYQCPGAAKSATPTQTTLDLTTTAESATTSAAPTKRAWPRGMAERVQALRTVLAAESAPVTVAELASRFSRAASTDLTDLLETLVLLGHVRRLDDGRFARV